MKSLRNRKKERGVATILVVGVLLFFLLFFFVLAIDFAYVYTVRGQLQNAADAAALAGASQLSNILSDTLQTPARDEAKEFAAENFAAGSAVILEDSDIEVGFWTGTDFISGITPVNAIKVSAKRIAARSNAVRLYFGHIVGWPTMDIERIAIASRPARANVPIAICVDACEPPLGGGGIINATTGTKFYWATPYDTDIINTTVQQIAWTEFSPDSAVNTGGIAPFFCGKVFDSCDTTISTTQGVAEIVVRQFRCAFLNPLYDSEHKTCVNNLGNPKACDSISDTVTTWKVLSPLTEECPPSDQGGGVEPYVITGYAEITVTDVFASGPATSAVSANNCSCASLGAENFTESSFSWKAAIINGITCVDCSDPDIINLVGRKSFLVR